MNIRNNIAFFQKKLADTTCKLIAVSKTQPVEKIQEAFEAGQRIFGENKVQELTAKQPVLPPDIEWHMIGHLQTNKVKQIAAFVSLIHSVDSFKLLEEINRQGKKNNRSINCLLQVHIAEEETKFGFGEQEATELILSKEIALLEFVKVTGLMGMATFTTNTDQVRKEFKGLKELFNKISQLSLPVNVEMKELSMGMSQDYEIAVAEGSTQIRIGTAIFGGR